MTTWKNEKGHETEVGHGEEQSERSPVGRVVMRRSMVFIGEDGSFKLKDKQRLCTHLDCKTTIEEPITHYPSRQHAIDAGWRYVDRGPFCNKGNYGVWVCPTCAKKIGA